MSGIILTPRKRRRSASAVCTRIGARKQLSRSSNRQESRDERELPAGSSAISRVRSDPHHAGSSRGVRAALFAFLRWKGFDLSVAAGGESVSAIAHPDAAAEHRYGTSLS